jgi:hypothetical protein
MGPRYLDPPSDEELGIAPAGAAHAGINYFGNTSTMEYQWERFGETVGLGAYDVYAMGILYGRVIETMEPDTARGGFAPADQQRFSARLRSQLSELDQIDWTDPVLNESGVLPIHYTELARQMRIFDPSRCRPATAQERERYRWRIVDGQLCSFAPRDHAAMTDFESTPTSATSERVAPMWRTRPDARTGGEVLRWGYRVGWDIATGYPHINYFDQGADPYEVTQSMIEKYRLTYPSLYFRRGQREFGRMSIPYYLARTIFRRLRGYHWSVARDTAYYSQAFSSALYERLTRDDNWLRPWLMAAPEIFDFFAGVLLRPEPGQYELVTNRPLPMETRPLFDVPDNSNADPQFEIGIVDGRFIGEEYDNTAGGSWDYHSYVRRAGAYPEKPLAAIMLTDTRPTFSSISRSLFLDGREFQLNFRNDMPRAYDRLLGGLETTARAISESTTIQRAVEAIDNVLKALSGKLFADPLLITPIGQAVLRTTRTLLGVEDRAANRTAVGTNVHAADGARAARGTTEAAAAAAAADAASRAGNRRRDHRRAGNEGRRHTDGRTRDAATGRHTVAHLRAEVGAGRGPGGGGVRIELDAAAARTRTGDVHVASPVCGRRYRTARVVQIVRDRGCRSITRCLFSR